MRTAGIDLSSQDKKSAACLIDWTASGASIAALELGVSDADITRLVRSVDKLGIDVPLGWPIAFAQAVSRHSKDGTWPESYRHASTEAYRYRRTDLHVWKVGGVAPLSVSTDRIGIPAMRAAAVLAAMDPRAALDGSGVVAEAYPAIALKRWGFPWRRYKGLHRVAQRSALVSSFAEQTSEWLALTGPDRVACEKSDDAFDALVAALVARAVTIGGVDPIPAEDRPAALREGWIALPAKRSLSQLANPRM